MSTAGRRLETRYTSDYGDDSQLQDRDWEKRTKTVDYAKLRQRLQETHVNYTGSHVTLYTVFVREYAQFDTLSLLCTLASTEYIGEIAVFGSWGRVGIVEARYQLYSVIDRFC